MSGRWQEAYKRKLRSPEEAVGLIPDGASIVQPIIAGEPPAILGAIAQAARQGRFTKLTMRALLPFAATKATVLQPDVQHIIRWESLFLGSADRDAVKEGRAGFTPNYFLAHPKFRDWLTAEAQKLGYL